MQSIFRLAPWSSDSLPVDKHNAACQKMRQLSSAALPTLNHLKRKRSASGDCLAECDQKRKGPCDTRLPDIQAAPEVMSGSLPHLVSDSHGAPTTATSPLPSETGTSVNMRTVADITPPSSLPELKHDDGAPLKAAPIVASHLTGIQRDIEHHFNIDILMKHRELRLIEQELAKCQVALEQLRRCEVIPFPGSQGLSVDIASGSAPSLRPQAGHPQPTAPGPWGVTDGPYSSHYKAWLLQDSIFDSQPVAPPVQDVSAVARTPRTSMVSSGWTKPVKSRASRESVSSISLGSVTPALRNKNGPLVIKRTSDNQFVKLACVKCHRTDFSSVQGFLNHCRIAHKIDYKSHEAAAQDCGVPLEAHEAGLVTTAAPPVGATPKAVVVKAAPPVPAMYTRVHPLNQASLPRPTWKRQRTAYVQALDKRQAATVKQEPIKPLYPTSDFVPSHTEPHLSAKLAQRGMSIDFAAIIHKLREPVDLGTDDQEFEDSREMSSPRKDSAAEDTKPAIARPTSRKGFSATSHRPRPAPLQGLLSSTSSSQHEIPESPQDSQLSPNGMDSNPGMVSDHEDEAMSDNEDTSSVIVAQEPIPLHHHTHRVCGDALDIDLQVDDDRDGHAVIIRARGSYAEDEAVAMEEGARSGQTAYGSARG